MHHDVDFQGCVSYRAIEPKGTLAQRSAVRNEQDETLGAAAAFSIIQNLVFATYMLKAFNLALGVKFYVGAFKVSLTSA